MEDAIVWAATIGSEDDVIASDGTTRGLERRTVRSHSDGFYHMLGRIGNGQAD